MKTFVLTLALAIGLIAMGGILFLRAQQTPPTLSMPSAASSIPTLPMPSAMPARLQIGVSTPVTVTIPLPYSNMIQTGINLIQVGPGTTQSILGQLHDDGQNGDLMAADNIYSIRLAFAPTGTDPITLEVSVAFAGLLKRAISPTVSLTTYSSTLPLPPDPGSAGMATLIGIDSDGDGVRDDVQRYIALTYATSAKTQSALTQIAKAELAMISNATNSVLTPAYALEQGYALECLSASDGPGPAGVRQAILQVNALNGQIQNTSARIAAFLQAEGQAETSFSYTLSSDAQSRCIIPSSSFPN